jgi:molecular chaperone GrpE
MTDETQQQVDEAAATDSDAQDLRQQLDEARAESELNLNKYLRALADMDNYKKRIERTYESNLRATKRNLLSRVLGVTDNLERALRYGTAGEVNGEGLMEGVRLTLVQLNSLLEQEGVKPINAVGSPFDPHLEEALQSVDDANLPDHTVVEEVRRGYTLGDEVLRPAQVIVNVHGSRE